MLGSLFIQSWIKIDLMHFIGIKAQRSSTPHIPNFYYIPKNSTTLSTVTPTRPMSPREAAPTRGGESEVSFKELPLPKFTSYTN